MKAAAVARAAASTARRRALQGIIAAAAAAVPAPDNSRQCRSRLHSTATTPTPLRGSASQPAPRRLLRASTAAIPPGASLPAHSRRSAGGIAAQRDGDADADPSSSSSSSNADNNVLRGYDLSHPDCNVTPTIASRVGTNLHLRPNHPLNTIKVAIESYWKSRPASVISRNSGLDGTADDFFATYDDLSPIVPTSDNFDSLLIPPDHVSRSRSDTYYLDGRTVLRTHTSAHQLSLLGSGVDRFLVTGDVYRRDEIDSSHYPAFHQMEGVRMFTDAELAEVGLSSEGSSDAELVGFAEKDLKRGLEGMARTLFGNVEMRWVDEYFPFTDPSYELEIHFGGEWMEVLGCGVVHRTIVRNAGLGRRPGWAFGLGLERLAMVLFGIPDIRLFWSEDERFHSQFVGGDVVKFEPYSKYPPCFKDISFWTSPPPAPPAAAADDDDDGLDPSAGAPTFHPNDLYEVVRDVGGDLVERVELIDEFVHPKTGRPSSCFRISYRSMDRSLTNEEVDGMQERVRDLVVEKLGVELR